MTNPKRLKEFEIVGHIKAFINSTENEKGYYVNISEKIDRYIENITPEIDQDSINTLKKSLELQYVAHTFNKMPLEKRKSKDQSVEIGNISSADPNVMASTGFLLSTGDDPLVTAGLILIGGIIGFVSAGYGLYKDIKESSNEIMNRQRVSANIGTIVLTGVIAISALAVIGSNPVGWGIGAGLALIASVALVYKGARALMNSIDAKTYSDQSGLKSDSRFRLTTKEELQLLRSYSNDDVEKIKEVIRFLASQAQGMQKTGVFGSKDAYMKIINQLTEVKKGNFDNCPELKEQFKIGNKKDPKVQDQSNKVQDQSNNDDVPVYSHV